MKRQTLQNVKTSLALVSAVFCVYLSEEDAGVCTECIMCYCLLLTGVKAYLHLKIALVTGKSF